MKNTHNKIGPLTSLVPSSAGATVMAPGPLNLMVHVLRAANLVRKHKGQCEAIIKLLLLLLLRQEFCVSLDIVLVT